MVLSTGVVDRGMIMKGRRRNLEILVAADSKEEAIRGTIRRGEALEIASRKSD